MSDFWEYIDPFEDQDMECGKAANRWRQKNGEEIDIKDMSDKHVYNAYRKTGSEALLKEMTVRLFKRTFL